MPRLPRPDRGPLRRVTLLVACCAVAIAVTLSGADARTLLADRSCIASVSAQVATVKERGRMLDKLAGAFRREGVVFRVSPVNPAPPAPVTTPSPPTPSTLVVCIDPGHQLRADSSPEPIGPGSTETKPSVAGGTRGCVSAIPEYRFTLSLALKIKARLEDRGVRVVMTRERDDVDISNAERAAIATAAGADLFVRIHADGSSDSSARGISTLYPSGNSWVRAVEEPSLRAARLTHEALISATGAHDRGILPRSDLAGFNWSGVPVFLVECGFMTNPSEDRLLASDAYQDQLAESIASGVMLYLLN